ncbi:MotA/TolQ/ExbB proton channel family protein (plasmid) [Burkholderia sp. FERM BP-3421]|uniref:MotA/TolQ/ExbB proton channel family protein n=1 Tax=Burkholderia sp. FERM BP-3421 TaxID=1494466 RepID=UPI0023625B4A|nr:MotA/TolQ/ExbB proton channel family protein [Burkholderia sp. FERM BP-3421]WDD90358.1 MotA/TolQ/ExbB proton channel family protein [Burkholderia sp. FERM BP-3421]
MNLDIYQMWARMDVVTHTIAALLIVMSTTSWAVILYKGMQLVKIKHYGGVAEQHFWSKESLQKETELFGPLVANNPYAGLANAAREAQDRHNDVRLRAALSSDEWLYRCLSVAFDEQVGRMTRGLGVLASVGSTAPFVGLFGTVWGIFHALVSISVAGQSSLAQVAGPVGESLVMTALGLFVAIPAVLGYNALSRINRGTVSRLHRFRHELHAYLMSGESRPA